MRCIVAALLLFAATAAAAGALTETPRTWAELLVPIPAQRLDELETADVERIRETRDRLDQLLTATDTEADALAAIYGRLGVLYAAHRLYAGAELALSNARALDPQNLRWAYFAAHIALEQGEAAQALDLLTEAERIDPDFPSLALRRGEALLGLNRLAEARTAYTKAADDAALRAAALYGLGQIDLLERQWGDAAARFDEVLQLQPDADAVHYPLGQALIGLGRRDAARTHLAQRGAIKPRFTDPLIEGLRSLQTGARFQFERGVAAVKRRDYAAAAAGFAAGLDAEPGNVRARTSFARALWLSGEKKAAADALHRAVAEDPDQTLPRFLLAVMQDAAGDTATAVASYRAVLASDPAHAGASSYLADLYLRRGDFGDAALHFERAIAAGATELPLLLHYWGALRNAGTDDSVLRDRLVAFDRRFPEPPVFRYLLATLLATSDDAAVADPARAVEIATTLNTEQPIPPHAELLALSLAAAGDFGEALQVQQGLIEWARMTGNWAEVAVLQQTADDYRAGRLPGTPWTRYDPMFQPGPADPEPVMRNYPAGQPY